MKRLMRVSTSLDSRFIPLSSIIGMDAARFMFALLYPLLRPHEPIDLFALYVQLHDTGR